MTKEQYDKLIEDIDKLDYVTDDYGIEYVQLDGLHDLLLDIPTSDVSIETLKQVMWERDQAMYQLEANSLRFGHKDDYGWISCKDRLPEEDGNYYCHVTHCDEEDFECHNEYVVVFYKGKWLTHNLVTYKVLAWRSLPKSYEVVEE